MSRFVAAGAAVVALGAFGQSANGQGAPASTLTRVEAPVVLQQIEPAASGAATGEKNVSLPPRLLGIAPGDLVAFRWTGAWEQIPVQVDEREMMDLNRIYGPGYPNCSDPCYSRPRNGVVHIEYTDPGTYVGPDTDATLDADDEVAVMARDAGGSAGAAAAPAGVDPSSAVQVRVTDSLHGGTGYVYLFERTSDLDPAAGRRYVDYDFQLADGKAYLDPSGSYRPGTTAAPSMARGPRPETSEVRTANYTRRFRDRWLDDDILIHKGGATGVDILDRHDALFDSFDATCVRTQATYRAGEGAFVANRSGPVRAIRDFIGANSGPHVQRQHVFYDGKEVINTFLRVHAVPGVVDFFDYSAAGLGLTYQAGLEGGLLTLPEFKIDGMADLVPPVPGASGIDGWESVDGPQGGLSMPQAFITNNPDPTYHLTHRDGVGVRTCNGDGNLYGASGPQATSAIDNTDEATGARTRLFYRRTIYFEAPGQADGAARLAEEQNGLALTVTEADLEAPLQHRLQPASGPTALQSQIRP